MIICLVLFYGSGESIRMFSSTLMILGLLWPFTLCTEIDNPDIISAFSSSSTPPYATSNYPDFHFTSYESKELETSIGLSISILKPAVEDMEKVSWQD